MCTNGEVFTDPAGEFTRIREALLGGYPEDLRRKKLASYLMSAAQSGQYNFLRSVRRGELVAAGHAETRYIADVISIASCSTGATAPSTSGCTVRWHTCPSWGPASTRCSATW